MKGERTMRYGFWRSTPVRVAMLLLAVGLGVGFLPGAYYVMVVREWPGVTLAPLGVVVFFLMLYYYHVVEA